MSFSKPHCTAKIYQILPRGPWHLIPHINITKDLMFMTIQASKGCLLGAIGYSSAVITILAKYIMGDQKYKFQIIVQYSPCSKSKSERSTNKQNKKLKNSSFKSSEVFRRRNCFLQAKNIHKKTKAFLQWSKDSVLKMIHPCELILFDPLLLSLRSEILGCWIISTQLTWKLQEISKINKKLQ